MGWRCDGNAGAAMQPQHFLRCSNAGAAMQAQHRMPHRSTAGASPPMEKVTPPMEKVTPPMEKVTDGKVQRGAALRRGMVFAPGSTTPPMEKVTDGKGHPTDGKGHRSRAVAIARLMPSLILPGINRAPARFILLSKSVRLR